MQVWIKKYNGGTLENQYEAKNIVNFDQGLDIPVQTFAMPESSSDDAILTKAEGNVEKINFSWIIKDEALSPARDGSNNYINSFTRNEDSTTWDPRTPDGAYVYLIENFEKIGIGDNFKYEFLLYDDANSKRLTAKYGVIQRISISKSATDPAVYNAAIEFQVGTDVTVE